MKGIYLILVSTGLSSSSNHYGNLSLSHDLFQGSDPLIGHKGPGVSIMVSDKQGCFTMSY